MDNLTSKERHKKVAERSQGLCELCYRKRDIDGKIRKGWIK